MSKSFLFVLWAGGGNVPPQLTLARRIAERGHDVRVLAPVALRARIEGAGLTYEPYVEAPEHDEAVKEQSLIRDFEARTPIGAVAASRERLLVGMAEPIARDVLGVLDRHHIDAVACDFLLLGGLFAAESARVPAAMLVHTVYPFPRPGVPPFGMGWTQSAGLVARVRESIGSWLFRRGYEAPAMPGLNRVRAELGLVPVHSFEDVVARTDRVLVLTAEAFDFSGPLPSNVRYVGAQVDEPELAPRWDPPWPVGDDRPLVAVGLTTTYQRHGDLLQRTVDALGSLPVKGFVSTGGLELERVPANVSTASFVPHARLLPMADVVVTHAGLGTVHAALANAKPLVCLPIGRDQPGNAARLVQRGAALRIRPNASAADIAAGISTVLGDARYAAAARRLSAVMGYDEAVHRGADELTRLAGSENEERLVVEAADTRSLASVR